MYSVTVSMMALSGGCSQLETGNNLKYHTCSHLYIFVSRKHEVEKMEHPPPTFSTNPPLGLSISNPVIAKSLGYAISSVMKLEGKTELEFRVCKVAKKLHRAQKKKNIRKGSGSKSATMQPLALWLIASLIPRPSHPSVCHLQGEGLVKLSHVQ